MVRRGSHAADTTTASARRLRRSAARGMSLPRWSSTGHHQATAVAIVFGVAIGHAAAEVSHAVKLRQDCIRSEWADPAIGVGGSSRLSTSTSVASTSASTGSCPTVFRHHDDVAAVTLPSSIYYHSTGRVSNCLELLAMVRFLAETLHRQLVVPVCQGVRTYYMHEHRQPQSFWCAHRNAGHCNRSQWAHPGSMYTMESLRGCRRSSSALPTPSSSGALETAQSATHKVVCVDLKKENATPGRCLPMAAGGIRSAVSSTCATELQTFCQSGRHSACCNGALAREMGLEVIGVVSVYMKPLDQANAVSLAMGLDAWLHEHGAWMLELRRVQGNLFFPNIMQSQLNKLLGGDHGVLSTCRQPTLSEAAIEFTEALGTKLAAHGLQQPYACVHWRLGVGDQPDDPRRRHLYKMSNATSAANLVQKLLVQHNIAAKSVLVLTESSNYLFSRFRDILTGAGLRIVSPLDVYNEDPETYTGSFINFEGTFAEKELCSRAALFLGDTRSTFSFHIDALASERSPVPVRAWSAAGPAHWDEVWNKHAASSS